MTEFPTDVSTQDTGYGGPSAESGPASLKIVHITNYQVPAYGYDEIQLSREQTEMGHDVTIITSNFLHPKGMYSVLQQRLPQRRVKPRNEDVDGVRIRRLPGREVARRVWITGLERALIELDPDVIHSHNLLQFHSARVAMLRATGRCRAAVVIDDHMHMGFVRRSILGKVFYRTYRAVGQPLIARYVDRFCAIAQDTSEYLRKECAVKGEIDIVPLGVTRAALNPNPDARRQMRERLGMTTSDLVAIYAGKVIPAKGIDLLIEATARLRGEGMRIAVIVVGDADDAYARLLSTLATELGQPDFHLMPGVDHDYMPELYAAADIGVWPRQESMAVFEAMAAGIPVVVSSSSGLAPVVAPDRGLTFSAGDVGSLATCLSRLTNADLRKDLGEAGQHYAQQELTWRRSAERYVTIYREAIARQPRR